MFHTYIDGNSIGHAAHARGGPRLVAGSVDTTAIFGALSTMRKVMRGRASSLPVVLWDGRSWRKDATKGDVKEYKANRVDSAEKVAAREAYKKARPAIARGFRLLGVRQLIASNMEADDLAAILVRNAMTKGHKVTLITGDKDWLQLVQKGVSWVDHKFDRKCTLRDFQEFTGYQSQGAFTDSKALQGDAGDNVPGCGGIGEKGAQELLGIFPRVQDFLDTPFDEAQRMWKEATGKNMYLKYRRLHQDPEIRERFLINQTLVDLNHPAIPKPVGLKMVEQPIDLDGFQTFCAEFGFSSILDRFDYFTSPFRIVEEQV